MAKDRYVAYVGTYTHGSSVGIHIFDVDAEKGKMTERKVVPINNPSDLIVSTSGKFLYSIADEGVQSFRILEDGDLEPINSVWTLLLRCVFSYPRRSSAIRRLSVRTAALKCEADVLP